MISSKDRSYYIGASDTAIVCGNWETETFTKWWAKKMGWNDSDIKTTAMIAGTFWEHRILESLNVPNLHYDTQIIKGHFRVNLDGNTKNHIYEVKTHSADKAFKVSKAYWQQAQVEMYAFDIRALDIVAYGLTEEDYGNFYRDVDMSRLEFFPIKYDDEFIYEVYLPRLEFLSKCIDEGRYPRWNSQAI